MNEVGNTKTLLPTQTILFVMLKCCQDLNLSLIVHNSILLFDVFVNNQSISFQIASILAKSCEKKTFTHFGSHCCATASSWSIFSFPRNSAVRRASITSACSRCSLSFPYHCRLCHGTSTPSLHTPSRSSHPPWLRQQLLQWRTEHAETWM